MHHFLLCHTIIFDLTIHQLKKKCMYIILYEIIDGEGGLKREDVNNWFEVDPLEPIRLELDEEGVYTWLVAF